MTVCLGMAVPDGDAGPGCGAVDGRVALGYPYREIIQPGKFIADSGDDSAGHMFKQVGWSIHLSGYDIVYPAVIKRIFQGIRFRSFAEVEPGFEVYSEKVAFPALVFEAAVVAVEFHSFQFYRSVPFHRSDF